jgi:hypothetical protein
MYLHIAAYNILFFYPFLLSTHLTISDRVRQDGRGDTEKEGRGDSLKIAHGAGELAVLLGIALKGIGRKANWHVLVHSGTLKEDLC